MSTFAVTDQDGSIIATNYLLSNLGQTGNVTITGNVLTANTTTGQITTAGSAQVISYLYQYIDVRYADNNTGSVNFNTSPTNRLYYGLRNRSATTPVSNNPADYIWYEPTIPFGTTNFLFYTAFGGRQILFFAGTSAPSNQYVQTIDNTPIDLDIVTASTVQQIVPVTIYRRSATALSTPTGGTYNFTTLTLTPPTGWYSSIPSGTDPLYTSQNTFESPASGDTSGPFTTWTTPVITTQNGSNGVSGGSNYTVTAYADSTSIPATPTGGTWNFTTSTGTAPTGNVTWSLDPFTPTNTLYTSESLAQIVGTTGTANLVTWTNPIEFGAAPGTPGVSVFYYSVFKSDYFTPSKPTGGFFNFGTGVGTPPTGWSNAPANVANTPGFFNFVTSAQVLSGNPIGNVSIGNSWISPVQYSGQNGQDGTNGQNGWTSTVFPALIQYAQQGNGTYTAANTTVTASFTSGNVTDTAIAYSLIDSAGTLNYATGNVSANIIITPSSNVQNRSLTLGFIHTPSQSTATEVSVASTQPFAIADPYGGSILYNTANVAVATIAAAPVISTVYSNGQFFTATAANVWTPAAVANVVSTTANVVVTRSNLQQGYIIVPINYNIVTGAFTTGTVTGNNLSRFTLGTATSSATNFYNTVLYADPDGATTGIIQVAITKSGQNGNTGPSGSRGFIPMAYVITPSDPTSASNATLTSWFSALRTNTVAPIGVSPSVSNIYTPISGDTAQFTYALGTGTPTIYRTYDGSAWNAVTGTVITGNVLVDGTITTNKLNVNNIYAINIQSTGANIGNASSNGFWLQSNTGSARFAGSTSIGANLIVGNSASIGANLIVGDSASIGSNLIIGNNVSIGGIALNGALVANIVTSTQLANGAVVSGKIGTGAVTAGTIGANAVTVGTIAQNAVVANSISANSVTAGKIATQAVFANNIVTGTITANEIAASTITGAKIAATTITATNIATNTITATQIAANTITATNIAAATITGDRIAAGTITTNNLAANVLTANTVVSTGATIGDNNSPGFWLQGSTGDARFGGNISIGNNLTVGNLITASGLNANVVAYNNLTPGLVPAPAGTTFNPGSRTINTAATGGGTRYDWLYTSGSTFGYYATLCYTSIQVTSAMAAASTSAPLRYALNFSCNVVGSGFLSGSSGPLFYLFSNDNYYPGGSNITLMVPSGASPLPAGTTTRGSLVSPQFGRLLGSAVTSYTGPLSLASSNFTLPLSGEVNPLVVGNYIVLGIGFFNSTSGGTVGSLAFSNMNWTVTLQ